MELTGICGRLVETLDWSKTPIGDIETWPPVLRALVQTLLRARHPMLLFWGPELTQFYNDAFLPSFGQGKHPAAMGQPAKACWHEVWDVVGAEIEGVMASGTPTWHADALIPILRNGRLEEVFWTYGYSPAYDETGRVAGTLVICTETTGGVLANRRLELLARVADSGATAFESHAVVAAAFECMKALQVDIPCAAAYHADGRPIVPGYGFADSELAALAAQHAGATEPIAIEAPRPIPAAPWPEPVSSLCVVPYLSGVIIFGLSPRLPFDDAYRKFLAQIVDSLRSNHDRIVAARKQLQAERERRDLLMQAPVAAALVEGPDLVFTLANPAYVKMVGREVIGQAYRDAFPEVVDTPGLDVVRIAYEDGVGFATDEMCIQLDRDGSGIPKDAFFKFNIEPIRELGGDVTGLMSIAVDITELVTARRAQEQALAERAALVQRLEDASRAKDEFLAMLGHELRNPLSPIITALELLKMRSGGSFAREHQIIERQARHLVRLVDDLLDVARIARGKIELKRQVCDVREVLARAVEMAEFLIDTRRHHLTIAAPAQMQWWGDPSRLAQVVSNLLTNAARYTPIGGEIGLSASLVDDTLEISVTDSGIGIAPDMLARIFDLFVQSPQEADRHHGGLGLGLTLTRNLVELHDGTVTARSDGPGEGSTFRVRLPAGRRPRVLPETEPSQDVHQLRILVVDDNLDAAAMIAARLESDGHIVDVVHDGVAALERFAQTKPHAALLDIGLPVMDGYELAARIQRDHPESGCRLIAVTGYGQPSDRARSDRAGFHAHLVKPVSFEALAKALAG